MEDIKPRLKAVRASVQELAEFMEVDYYTADRIVNGRRKHLKTAESEAITRFFELRERPIYGAPEAASDDKRRTGTGEKQALAEIPLFGGADTADGWMLSLSANRQVGRVTPHPAQARARKAYAVEVVDGSMSPRFEMGEIAYVSAGMLPRPGQDCLVEFQNLTARILRFVERNPKHVVFEQLNPPARITLKPGAGWSVHAIVGRGG